MFVSEKKYQGLERKYQTLERKYQTLLKNSEKFIEDNLKLEEEKRQLESECLEELRREREGRQKNKKLFDKLWKKRDLIELFIILVMEVCALGLVCSGVVLVQFLIHALAGTRSAF